MIRHVLLRILYTLPALWLILTMVFLMVHIVPGDPVLQMLGQDARVEDIAQLRHTLGLDEPLGVQYARYLEGLARGDWGRSIRFAAPVRAIVLDRFPATMELSLAALLVCIAIAIPAGVFSAWRRGSRGDRATSFFTLLGLSVPNFALGPVLILVFSVEIGWLPVSGRGGASHLILPARHFGCGSRGDSDSHGPRFHDRRTFERLCADGSRQGNFGNVRVVPARISQRIDSSHHDRRTSIWFLAGGNDRHRIHFFLARDWTARCPGHFRA